MKRSRRKHSIRKKDWDYRTPGYYFITFCTYNRTYHFEDKAIKEIIEKLILQLPTFRSCHHIKVDTWVVMPNHVHLLIYLDETIEYRTEPYVTTRVMPKSVGAVVGTLRKNASRQIKKTGFEEKIWQRGYYDRIVRNEEELNRIREYVRLNPIKWAEDHENLDRLLETMDYHP